MPHNVTTTKPIALESSPESGSPTDLTGADVNADRMMNDLFEDVDRILDGGSLLPIEPAQPEYVSLQTINIPHLVLPTITLPPPEVEPVQKQVVIQQQDTTAENEEKQRQANQSFDRMLLGGAFACLAITMGLWLGSRGGVDRWWTTTPQTSTTTKVPSPQAEADAQFGQYMVRSLEIIDQKTTDGNKLNPALPVVGMPLPPVPPASGNFPDVNNLVAALNRVALSLDRFYPSIAQVPIPGRIMPVLPKAPQNQANIGSNRTPAKTAQQPSKPASPQTGTVKATRKQQSNPSPTAVAAAPPVSTPVETPLPAPAATQPTSAPETPPTNNTTATATSPTPASTPSQVHTLVGLLELGDRSAALFEVNGVARRVYIGETIGSSDWTLVKIGKGEAVIRRGGEVRSIYVGQNL